jgi:hypothetical protein
LSTKYATSLRLELKPSRLYSRLIVIAHLLALAACLFNALPLALRSLGFAAVMLNLFHALQQNRRVCRLIEFHYSDAGGWNLCSDGKSLAISLSASTISTSWIVLLHYRIEGRRGLQTLPIFCDAVAAEDYRQLKVALRVAALR